MELFPMGNIASSEDEVVAKYSSMRQPAVDTWDLASWLLTLALSSQQIPQQEPSPGTLLDTVRKRFNFARAVRETVERSLLSHDSLLGTIEGFQTALLYLRL